VKIRAGRDVDVGGDVIESGGDTIKGKKPGVWNQARGELISWTVIVLVLIVTTGLFYFVSGRLEVVFAELIGLALGYLAKRQPVKNQVADDDRQDAADGEE